MKLANPIYDTVFKYLMEDTEIARRLISQIIGEEITQIEVRPQEQTHKSDKHDITVFRLDFKATIKLKQATTKSKKKDWKATHKTVLIELQKAKKDKDIERFRRYLGSNYRTKDTITDESGNVQSVDLPIVTIYILGYPMPPIETSVLKINRVYIDLNTNQPLDIQTEFIEKLTHDCYAILIKKLPKEARSELERILQVFNQTYILDVDNRFLEFDKQVIKNNELLKLMSERLRDAALDEYLTDAMLIEKEVDEEIDRHIREKQEKDEIIKEQNEELKEKDDKLKEKSEELNEKNKLIEELQRQLKDKQ